MDGAEILESPEEIERVEEGNNITLSCVGTGYPPPLVQWRKLNGSEIANTNISMVIIEGSVTNVTVDLIITDAYREDTGVYECFVNNSLSSNTTNFSLIVQYT